MNRKSLIFALLFLTCLCLSMSFVSANNITDIDDSNNKNNDELIVENHPNKSFTDLNKKSIDLNESEIILEENNVYQENHSNYSGVSDINKSTGDVVPVNYVVDYDMPQFIPTLSIDAGDKYIIGKDDVINIVFKTNPKNKHFWVEVPGLLSKCNLTSDNNFCASITLDGIVESGNYTVLCGFYDYIYPVVAGSDDIPGVACKKIIEIIYTGDMNKFIFIESDKVNTTANIIKLITSNTVDNETIRIPVSINNTCNETHIKSVDTSEKLSSIVVAKNKIFNEKLKTKLYPVVLKSNDGKVLKNTWVTLKINGKLFKAKTNSKGKATFKITKLTKKGKYKATVAYKGNNCYNKASKKVKLVLK